MDEIEIIEELERNTLKQDGVISLPEVHSVLYDVFHYDEQARKQLLYKLEKRGFIRVRPLGRGIEIIYPRIAVNSEK